MHYILILINIKTLKIYMKLHHLKIEMKMIFGK